MLRWVALAYLLVTGIAQCLDKPVNTPYSVGDDLSWKEYLRYVYGDGTQPMELDRYKLNFLYKNTPVQVVTREWKHNTPLDALNSSWGDTVFRRSSSVSYAHNQWAEVNRYSTYFLNSYKKRDVEWEEGYSNGFPGRSRNETKVAYGCWFNLARGSGIFVNVGRTLVVDDKYHASLFQHLNLTSKACPLWEISGHKCYDRYFCTAALAKGYDSVQITGRSELVICNGKCATEPLRYTCPAISMRNGYNASGICKCSDSSHVLNCGNLTTSIPNLALNFPKITPKPVRRHKLCAARHAPAPSMYAFNLTLAFTSGVLENEAIALRAGKFAESLALPEGLLLVDVGTAFAPTESAQAHGARRRKLWATPMGPYQHAFPPPPPGLLSLGSQEIQDAGTGEGHRAEYFHSQRHDHHDHYRPGMENTETQEQARWRQRLQVARYGVVVADQSTASRLWAGGDIPVLSATNPSMFRTTIVMVGNVKVGFIAYAGAGVSGAEVAKVVEEEHVREYVDEAVCLRNAGAEMVVLMTRSGSSAQALVRGLKGYVDLVIAAGQDGQRSCDRQWHADGSEVPVVQIKDASLVGVVNVQRQRDSNPSFQSRIAAL